MTFKNPGVRKKFANAFLGIYEGLKTENSFQFQMAVGVLVVGCGFLFEVTRSEWMFLSLAIGTVLTLELINTLIERVLDFVCPEPNVHVRIAKDMASGVVLIASLTAVVIGCLVFWPYIQRFL